MPIHVANGQRCNFLLAAVDQVHQAAGDHHCAKHGSENAETMNHCKAPHLALAPDEQGKADNQGRNV